jgi:hypothetical protein
MATINMDVVKESNKKIAEVINLLGNIVFDYDLSMYQQIVKLFRDPGKEPIEEAEEADYLHNIYIGILDILKSMFLK